MHGPLSQSLGTLPPTSFYIPAQKAVGHAGLLPSSQMRVAAHTEGFHKEPLKTSLICGFGSSNAFLPLDN